MNELIELCGWTLFHSLWQGVVGVVLAALIGLFLRPEARYRLHCLVLLCCVLLPAITAFAFHAPAPNQAMALPSSSPLASNSTPVAFHTLPDLPLWVSIKVFFEAHLHAIVAIWAFGAAVMTCRLAGGHVLCRSWKRNGQRADDNLENILKGLAQRLGITRSVNILLIQKGHTPFTFGFWKPVVLLPMSLVTSLPPEYLTALLAHELAHVRRQDYLFNLIQSAIEALLFFHPAIWWLSVRIRAEREELTDALAAKTLGEPRRLALALNLLDDLQPTLQQAPFPALAAHTGGNVFHRIEKLISPKPASRPSFGLLAALLIPMAALSLKAALPDTPPIQAEPELVAQVDALAQKEGIDPQLLRSIAWAESHFNPNAKSPTGAMGLLQVTPNTARKHGALDLNNPDQVAAAGARYLGFLLKRYNGDVQKAVTAYNCGEVALEQGAITPEAQRYQATVMDLYRAKAIQPETPLKEGEVVGTFWRTGEKAWELNAKALPLGNFTLRCKPKAIHKENDDCLIINIGDNLNTKDHWQPFCMRAMSKGKWPEETPLIISCKDEGTNLTGTCEVTLSGQWATFRLKMNSPKQP